MAAFSSKNSSSYYTSNQFTGRPNNPTPRNSEISNPMRRSFSGSPFGRPSPVISGQRGSRADYQRRHSIGRDNVVASPYDYQEKENSKDLSFRVSKSRSPAPLTKDPKNFMSPTISAASKIHPSPRKKILVDGNEPTHTSVSSSDGKGLFSEEVYMKPEKHSNHKKEVSFDANVTYLEDQQSVKRDEDSHLKEQTDVKDDLDAFPQSLSTEKDLVNLDPSFKISPRAPYYCLPVPAVAPLDADPSVQTPSASDADPLIPPYDPKTNYLSPRPQFLHYRPNPRIELYLKKDRDGTQLEFFSSECSDAEDTEGETPSENSQKASEDSSSDDPLKEVEEEKMEEEKKEEMLVSGLKPISTTKTATDGKQVSKLHFFTKSKLIALFLLLAVGCLWVSVSHLPIMDPSVFNNLEFPQIYIPPELTDFAKNNLHAFTQKLQTRLCNCYSYINNMLSNHRERCKLNSLMYANLTTLLEDGSGTSDVILDHSYSESEVISEGSVLLATIEEEFDSRLVELKVQQVEVFETTEEILEVDYQEYFEEQEEATLNKPGFNETTDEVIEYDDQEHLEEQEEAALNNPGVNETTDEVIEYDDQEHLEEQEEAALNNPGVNETTDEVVECDDQGHLEEQEEAILANSRVSMELNFLMGIGIGFFAIGLLGTMAMFYVRTRKSAASITLTPLNQVPSIEKLDKTLNSASKEHTFHERPSSRICHTDMDLLGYSCPSESSFQSSSYNCRKGLLGSNEAESQERWKPRKKNYRRESLASSDYSVGGSLSYGSFMTHEKITNKHGNGDDEQVVTPVRRSSRIRKQVTSP